MSNEPKEVAVFKTYTKYNKLKVLGIALGIIIVAFILLYLPIKTLFTYTVTYHLNGGSVYNQELVSRDYKFLEKIEEPVGVKKFGVGENGEEIGYYIDHWSKKSDLSDVYQFGGKMWSSFDLYVKWELGVAVRLHFADGEENSDMSTQDLKGYYEQYVKPGSDYTLPTMYNDKVDTSSLHYGEQLMWYDNPECEGEPFFTKTYSNLQESIDIYGVWIDTSESKFEISEGTLNRYLGHCNKVMLPSIVTKIKDVDPNEFIADWGDSVWAYVTGTDNSNTNLKEVYLNAELTDIGDCAFRNCQALERVIFLGDNVTDIGKYAFAMCKSLQEFEMPSKVKVIETGAFEKAFNRKSQISLDLSNIERIEDDAFNSSTVYSIKCNHLQFIGNRAFGACNDLISVDLSKNTQVPTSNVDVDAEYNGIFCGVTIIGANANLKIYVPISSKAQYLVYPYWNTYAGVMIGK